jgi:heat shock protein HtpX
MALASALKKISVRDRNYELSPSTAHMYIFNPLSGGGLKSLFSTHPPVEDRVARLEAMAGGRR